MRKDILIAIASLLFLVQTNLFAQATCGWQQNDFKTYAQSQWGDASSEAGLLLESKFNSLYGATNLVIGGTNTLRFHSALNVTTFLPTAGIPAALTGSLTNPITSSAGELAGQVLALQLNVDFSDADYIDGIFPFGDLVIHDYTTNAVNGMTVRKFLQDANIVLGGGSVSFNVGAATTVASLLNNAFVNGTPSQFAQEHLRKGWSAGEMITYNQLSWGTSGSDAATNLGNNYNSVYTSSGGVFEIGIPGAGNSITFNAGSSVITYLPATGPSGPLSGDAVNPTSTNAGLFGGEVVALKLNIDFNDGGFLSGTSDIKFADLLLKDLTTLASFNGTTVRNVLATAETALGGGSVSVSINDLVLLVKDLNDAFESGTPSQFAQEHLKKNWQQGEMLTYSQTDYGNGGSSTAFALLNANFNTLYPTTLNVGSPNQMIFDDAGSVYYYLPDGGPAGVLTSTVINPLGTSAGELGSEVLTLKINVNFSDADLLTGSEPLGNLILYDLPTLPVMNGLSVREFLVMANSILGGTTGLPVTPSQAAALARFINQSFLNGTPSPFAIDHLRRSARAGDLETYTQTNWGDASSDAGTLLSTHYAKMYGGNFFLVGGNFRIGFTSAAAVHAFLPQLSSAGTLTANLINPATTPAGELAGEVTALQLNVDFSDANLLPGTIPLGDWVFHDCTDLPVLNGQSIRQFLAAANILLGGGSASFTASEAATVARLINEAFLNGTPSQFAIDHLAASCGVVNHCPTASSASITTSAGTAANIQLQATDEDDDELTYSISVNALHGTVTTSSTGAAVYTPTAGYYGTDEFKFKANDGSCDGEGTVSITVVQCPKGAGYWKNNSVAWPVTSLMLGSQTYSQTQLLNILNMPIGSGPKADASLILADQLIGVKLSLANGSPVATDLSNAIASADALIGSNTIPMKIKPNSNLGQQMITIANFLASYNLGSLTEGCHAPAVTSSKQTNAISESTASINGMQVKAYPNPSNNNFSITVQADAQEKIMMQVIDMYGRVIEVRNMTANSITRFGDRYRPGTYFIRVIQGKQHKELKLVKLSD